MMKLSTSNFVKIILSDSHIYASTLMCKHKWLSSLKDIKSVMVQSFIIVFSADFVYTYCLGKR